MCFDDLLKPPDMHANVVCKFRMEAGPKNISLPHSHNIVRFVFGIKCLVDVCARNDTLRPVWQDSEDMDGVCGRLRRAIRCGRRATRQDLLYDRSSDEYPGVRGRATIFVKEGEVDVCYEALHLSAEVVSSNSNVKTANELLTSLLRRICLFREQNKAGTRAPGGFPGDSSKAS